MNQPNDDGASDGQDDRVLAGRCAPIELLIADVDGVLTDGTIAVDAAGSEIKHFHVRDGLGYALWHRAGKVSAILSGRRAAAVERRAAELSIAHVLQGHDAKAGPYWDLLARLGFESRQVCYIGDDLPDIPVLRAVGLAACPADAVAEVRESVHFVANAAGGRGAVREVVEVILKSQGKWNNLVSSSVMSEDVRHRRGGGRPTVSPPTGPETAGRAFD